MFNYKAENRPYFMIPSAFITEGYLYILIFDTERKENFIVSIKYKKFIENEKKLSLKKAKIAYGYTDDEFNDIIEFLIANDLIYFSNMIDFYKPIQALFDYPANITNAIIDIGNNNKFTSRISSYLMQINCYHLQIRYLRKIDIKGYYSATKLTINFVNIFWQKLN